MNRQAMWSVGLFAVGVAFAMGGCEDDPSTPAAEAGQAGQAGPSPSAGESSGGSGSVVLPQAGEGGMPQAPGGGGQPEGGTAVVAQGGAGGVPGEGGAGGRDDSEDARCIIPSTFGPLSTLPGQLFRANGGSSWRAELPLEAPATATLAIELVPGFPPFEEGVTTVSNHVLTGPDLNYGTCGLCLRLLTYPNGEEESLRHYYVTGGTITVSEVEGGMTGTASNLTFEEVTLNETTFYTTPVPDGCETSITSVSFDESVGAGGSGGAGG